jgi:glycosyltransferase involved in cell wall biosynthesis
MKIAWFTPFSSRSAIGRYSDVALSDLARHATVDLWHCEGSDIRQSGVRTVRFSRASDIDLDRLGRYDLVVYNFGNHLPFHKEIFHISRRFPGVHVLHDFVMHHFFAAYYLEDLKSPELYADVMDRLYGEDGRAVAENVLAGKRERVWETDEVVKYPLFEEAIRGAYGVITHSHFLAERVRRVHTGPVTTIPLCYNAMQPKRLMSRRQLGVSEEDTLLLTVGHVNPNKRIHAVIQAVGSMRPALRKLTYAVLGPYDPTYHSQLAALARTLPSGCSVRFLGYAPEDILHSYLIHADICVNLRFPAIEGASASVIEEMLNGKAVIVTNAGFYQELPDECVVKIDLADEGAKLADALARLVANPIERQRYGAQAREYAEKQFCPSNYRKQFLQFAWEVRATKPILQLADRMASRLREMGVESTMKIIESVSSEASTLF